MGNEPLSLTLRVDDWQLIDATIDNTVSIAAQNGDESTVARGMAVRRAGWAANKAHPRNQDGWGGWPPADDQLTVALGVDTWHFVIEELHRWEKVASDVGAAATSGGGEPGAGSPESRRLAVARMLADRLDRAGG